MGLFGSSSPFDADVERATNEKNTADDWGLIMDICDKVGNNPVNAKDCLRSIIKRLNHNDPHVAIQAVTLLDACVNNCGKNFHLEVASREFENEYRKLLTRSHQTVQLRLKALLKKWSENEFKNDPQLNLIPALYYKLRQEGHVFLSQQETSTIKRSLTTSSNPINTISASGPKDMITSGLANATTQEEADIAKAIELSLKEGGASPGGGNKTTSSLYPSTNLMSAGSGTTGTTTTTTTTAGGGVATNARKVRALYDFEAAEDNELTFKAGEIVHVIDDSDPNWWKGYNQRGEGLFPANFVTADLSVEPEQLKTKHDSSSANNNANANRMMVLNDQQHKNHVIEIDELKIDRLIHLLHEADPNDTINNDPKELIILEDQVNSMAPLIDNELERVDRKHAQLTQLSADLVDALNLYHQLMREPALLHQSMMLQQHQHPPQPPYMYQSYGPPPGPPPQGPPPPSTMMYNGGGGPLPPAPPSMYQQLPPPGAPPVVGAAPTTQQYIQSGAPPPQAPAGYMMIGTQLPPPAIPSSVSSTTAAAAGGGPPVIATTPTNGGVQHQHVNIPNYPNSIQQYNNMIIQGGGTEQHALQSSTSSGAAATTTNNNNN